MLATRPGRRVADDSGASAVEFALVVPLLLLLVFGIINFGVQFSQQLTMNNAVREGARRAVVNDSGSTARTCAGILNSVQNQLSALGINRSAVEVKITQDTLNDPTKDPDTATYGTFPGGQDCGSSYVSTSAGFGSSATHVPCLGSYDSTIGARNLIVQARYVSSIPIAFPPFPTTLTLSSKAVYRCEFTS